jgi:hypothetical protein
MLMGSRWCRPVGGAVDTVQIDQLRSRENLVRKVINYSQRRTTRLYDRYSDENRASR